jgi:hypothetical protein
MTRIAYCVMVHKNPDQVARCLKKIYTKEDLFHYQIFRTKNTPSIDVWKEALSIENNNNVFLFSNYKGSYATFRFVKAGLEAMNFFQENKYDYFINLSGQCYPIKSISQIKQEMGAKKVAYLHHEPLPSKNLWNGGLNRIQNYWFNVGKYRFHIPKIQKLLPYHLKPYWGWNWFCLPKKFVDYILQYITDHPKLMPYFSYSLCSDEIFFQTIIMNSPLRSEVVNEYKRYIDWEKKGNPHPKILTSEDFPKIRDSGMWFARKFDMNVDSKILDMIDKSTGILKQNLSNL